MDMELQPWTEFWRMIASLGAVTLVFWLFSLWGGKPEPAAKPRRRTIKLEGMLLTVDESADGKCEVMSYEVPGSGLDPARRGEGRRLKAFWDETVESWKAAQREDAKR
jgi:hypothetical protein